MSKQIFIYTEQTSSRVNYAFELIFKELMNFDKVNIVTDILYFNKIEHYPKFSYSKVSLDNNLFLAIGTNLLFEKGINDSKPLFTKGDKFGFFFRINVEDALLPFDLPAAVFWLVSRYEEYQDFEADRHNRFSANQSYAFQNNFLDLPLINIWVDELATILKNHFKNYPFPVRKGYRFIPSYDIDYAWAYRNKGIIRNFAAGIKDFIKLDFNTLIERILVLSDLREDPFFTFSYIKNLHIDKKNKPLLFWLLGDFSEFDKNISYLNKNFRTLMQEMEEHCESGIHPSYVSNILNKKLKVELERLEKILSKKIIKSRQHYLRLHFPNTYHNLLNYGIKDDYTMGYADQTGFRASIANSYFWYDLQKETQTDLKIHPFMLMDVTLQSYLKLDPEAALEKLLPLIEITKKVGGELISIWHNNSFCEKDKWKGWRKMYEQFLDKATE